MLLVGRSSEVEVTVDDPMVSRIHTQVERQKEGVAVMDRGSSNGTWVNGRPVSEKIKLANGSLIRVGDTQIRFACIEGSIPIQPL